MQLASSSRGPSREVSTPEVSDTSVRPVLGPVAVYVFHMSPLISPRVFLKGHRVLAPGATRCARGWLLTQKVARTLEWAGRSLAVGLKPCMDYGKDTHIRSIPGV